MATFLHRCGHGVPGSLRIAITAHVGAIQICQNANYAGIIVDGVTALIGGTINRANLKPGHILPSYHKAIWKPRRLRSNYLRFSPHGKIRSAMSKIFL